MKKIFFLSLFLVLPIHAIDVPPGIYAKYFSNCDYIDDTAIYTNCISTKHKIPIVGYTHLINTITKARSKPKSSFHIRKSIPPGSQGNSKIYTITGMDRGHFSASRADFDDTAADQYLTYAYTNITPQYSITNRRSYLLVENYIRRVNRYYPEVDVITIAIPSYTYINTINIPYQYFKEILYGSDKRCFLIPNDNIKYKLTDMNIDCNDPKYKNILY